MIVLLCCYTGAKLNCYCLFYAMTRESAPEKRRQATDILHYIRNPQGISTGILMFFQKYTVIC